MEVGSLIVLTKQIHGFIQELYFESAERKRAALI